MPVRELPVAEGEGVMVIAGAFVLVHNQTGRIYRTKPHGWDGWAQEDEIPMLFPSREWAENYREKNGVNPHFVAVDAKIMTVEGTRPEPFVDRSGMSSFAQEIY